MFLQDLDARLLELPTLDGKRPISILHVDDESAILETTKNILELDNVFHVTSCRSVNEALNLIAANDFDVILSDYQMSGKDGLDFLTELRAQKNRTPFILFTGKGREDVAIKALNLGADYYVNKIGKPETIFGELTHIIRKVVKQNRAELKLTLERQRLQTVTKNMSAGLAVISKDFKLLWANNVLMQIFGDNYKGKKCYELINGLKSPCHLCGVHKLFEEGSSEVVHEQVVKADNGQDVWHEITVTPIKDSKGRVTAALELVHDITDRKKAQMRINDNEEQFRQLFSHMPSGVAVYEAVDGGNDFVIKDFNKAGEFIDKKSRESVIGKSVTEVFPGVKDFGLFDILQQVYKSGQLEYFPLSFYKDDKHFGWRENWVYKLPNGDIVAVYNDVTERKNVEEIIQTLKHSIDQAGFGIMIASLDGVLLYVNEGARHMWGFSKADKLKGKPIDSGFAETEKEKIATAMENVNKVGSWSGEVVAKRKDGSHFDAKVSASLIKDFNGTSLHIVAYSVDVTEKTRTKKALNSSTSQLALINEKLSVVGRLTRHDSRNKLAAISANLYLAKKHLSKNHEALKYLVSIESDITQIDRILEFSRVYEQLGMEELSKIDVGKSFDTAVSFNHNLDKITFVNACNGVSVLADSLLDTLFYNLIDNSVAHGEKVSKISIYSETLYDDSLRLVYEDNGVGIAKKEKEKIFQEGYGKGTGMGLHMIKILCKIYGFTIKETGQKNKGAQFEIQIPKNKYSLLNVKRDSKIEKVFSEI